MLEHSISLYPFLLVGMLGDSIASSISGVLRAIGREHLASSMYLVLYVFGGQTLSWFYCFYLNMELEGIWLGIITVCWTYILTMVGDLGLFLELGLGVF